MKGTGKSLRRWTAARDATGIYCRPPGDSERLLETRTCNNVCPVTDRPSLPAGPARSLFARPAPLGPGESAVLVGRRCRSPRSGDPYWPPREPCALRQKFGGKSMTSPGGARDER